MSKEDSGMIGKEIRLIFEEDNRPSAYATNITVQHTEHEFVISFYEARPPIILGSREEREEQVKSIVNIFAPCIARITVAASRMGGFVRALDENYAQYLEALMTDKVTEEQ